MNKFMQYEFMWFIGIFATRDASTLCSVMLISLVTSITYAIKIISVGLHRNKLYLTIAHVANYIFFSATSCIRYDGIMQHTFNSTMPNPKELTVLCRWHANDVHLRVLQPCFTGGNLHINCFVYYIDTLKQGQTLLHRHEHFAECIDICFDLV